MDIIQRKRTTLKRGGEDQEYNVMLKTTNENGRRHDREGGGAGR